MRLKVLVFVILNIYVLPAQPPRAGYTLLWKDDFDSTALNTNKWSVLDGKTRSADENKTCYQKQNVSVSGGTLKLTVNNNGSTCAGTVYSGGCITSTGSYYNNKYGYFEARIRYNTKGPGFWGNFWMNSNEGWPPEFDIGEMISNLSGETSFAYHYYNETNTHLATAKKIVIDYTQWHVYGIEWMEGPAIRFYLDGALVFEPSASLSYPPNEKMSVILRMGAFNNSGWGGLPDSTTQWPGAAEYDWVKVWKKTSNPDNILPTVSLLSPTSHSFTPNTNIDIKAYASDYDGKIVKVEFYNDDVKLGDDTVYPYSYTWTNVPAGTYAITAKAYDVDGGTKSTNPFSISSSLGLPDLSVLNDIEIYPTHVVNLINIENANGCTAMVISCTGTVCLSARIEHEVLNIESLLPGLYILSVKKDKMIINRKFIKL